MKKTKFPVALFLLLIACYVEAGEWHIINVSSNNAVFVDATSIVRTGSRVKVWEWVVMKNNEIPYNNLKISAGFDCANRTHWIEKGISYKDSSYVAESAGYGVTSVVPDTLQDHVMKAVCSTKPWGKSIPTEDVLMMGFMGVGFASMPK